MSRTKTELGSRPTTTEWRTLRPRLIFVLRVSLALLTLVAVLFKFPLLAALLLLGLIALLLLPPESREITTPLPVAILAATPLLTVPLMEEVTRQLSTSLSIGQVANIVLSAALRTTGAEAATLAMPPEVNHYTTIQLRRGQENVQIIPRPFTGATLIEQVFQEGHQGRAMMSRDGSGIAVMLRHEYLVIGALSVESQPETLTETHADLLSEIAVPAAISLHNARLLDDQQYQIDTLSHIQALILRLAGAVDRRAVAQGILEATRDILGVQEVALYRSTSSGLELILSLHRDRFSRSQKEKRLTRATALKTAQLGEMQITREPVTCVAVPVERGGEVHEVLAAAFIERHTLRQRDLNTLLLLAGQTAAHLDTVEQYEQVRTISDRLRVTMNSAEDAILLIDPLGKLIECNPSAEWLLGIDKARYVGKPFVVMLFEMMKTGDLAGLGYSRAQLPELARQLRYEPTVITRRRFEQVSAGQNRMLEEIGCPIIDGKDQILGRLLVLRDVTEQKHLADFRDEMIHMAVHDLRGPLTAIMNGIDMTLKLGLTEYPEDNERVLRLSLASASDLMKVINGLLDIARLESRRMPVHPQPVTAAQLVESACQTLDSSIADAQIELEVVIPENLPLLNVDFDLMRRVLVNLLDNALRFTPEGEKILIAAEQTNQQDIIFSVADSGPGIPVEERERVFEQYQQSSTHKPLRGSNGTGLGLSFCKLAVEAHGGSIWVGVSDLLPGACMNLRLPVTVPA
ncbi:MAG: ATP-binding protein [Chloroflexota bacterium]